MSLQDVNYARAEDLVARLDERLSTSPVAAFYRSRTHFADAAASVYLEGELVHFEDLALHAAAADIRAPYPALIRAYECLRTRRNLERAPAGSSLTQAGMAALKKGETPPAPAKTKDDLSAELAAIDVLLARSARTLEGHPPPPERHAAPELFEVVQRAERLPPVLAAATVAAAADEMKDQAWIGRLAAADLLRARGKTHRHLMALSMGRKLVRKDRRADRIEGWIQAIALAAETGLRDHDRWLTVRKMLERKVEGRRSNSKLPAMVSLVMASPIVTAEIVVRHLRVSPRAAQDLIATLDLQELSGRTRYRCWGIL